MKTKMILTGWLFILICVIANATIINVPDDQPTIQAGINFANDADTVLVQLGTYIENINYNGKNIVVGSLFLTTGDTSYISQTIIDGDQNGSVVTFENEENSTAVLCGFTITNGYAHGTGYDDCGGGIFCHYYTNPSIVDVIISGNIASDRGGGFFCNEESGAASLTNVTICGNTANKGGGIANGFGYPSSLNLSNVTIKENNATYGGGIYWEGTELHFVHRCNIFLNSANIGGDLYVRYAYSSIIKVIVDTFTVLHPNDYYAFPVNNFEFDILHYIIKQFNQDLYVSPTGSDDNSGLSPDDPLLTITKALKIIYVGSANPHTIHLANGIYSPSQTGETFPLYCQSYLSLQGEDEYFTILDGDALSNILYCHNDNNLSIEYMTIQNGNTSYRGGGIYCKNSSPSLVNITICENTAGFGGGLNFLHSNPSLIKVTISGNNANYDGGGIYCDNSDPILTNVTISGNIAGDDGGGISSSWGSSPGLLNCILWNDFPQEFYLGYQSSITVSYSNIQDGWTGTGNIDADPLFADPQNGDFHLTWANFPIPDSTMSPCIDAGDPASPLDPDSTRADMGAFYFDQSQQGVDDNYELGITNYELMSNYPNPFHTSTTILFNLATRLRSALPEQAKIEIYNIKGQKVKTFKIPNSKFLIPNSITWDGKDESGKPLSSGIYFYKLKIDNKIIDIKKCLLLR